VLAGTRGGVDRSAGFRDRLGRGFDGGNGVVHDDGRVVDEHRQVSSGRSGRLALGMCRQSKSRRARDGRCGDDKGPQAVPPGSPALLAVRLRHLPFMQRLVETDVDPELPKQMADYP